MTDPCAPLQAQYDQLEQDYRTLVAEHEGFDAHFTEAIRQRDLMQATLQAVFLHAGAEGVELLGQVLTDSREAEAAQPNVWRAIAIVARERNELAGRIERALAGLKAANVYEGSTARILRGTAQS